MNILLMSDHLIKRPPEKSLSLRELKFTSTYSIMVYLLAGKSGPGLLSELGLRQRPSFQREQSSPYINKAIFSFCVLATGSRIEAGLQVVFWVYLGFKVKVSKGIMPCPKRDSNLCPAHQRLQRPSI
jgi:hypothetical protein